MSVDRGPRRLAVLGCALAALAPALHAQESALARTLAERFPELPRIDEISKTPVPGLYELRIGSDLLYSDERGNHLIRGSVMDTRTRINLTEARVAKLTAIDFRQLPLKDAIVWKTGSGERKVAVFADPNCGFCKQFERTLQEAKDLTVYTFLLPVLNDDSHARAKAIWCAKDNTTAWRDWMLQARAPSPPRAPCDASAIERNLALSRRHKVTGTPAVVFEDGARVPGAMPIEALERQLASTRRGG